MFKNIYRFQATNYGFVFFFLTPELWRKTKRKARSSKGRRQDHPNSSCFSLPTLPVRTQVWGTDITRFIFHSPFSHPLPSPLTPLLSLFCVPMHQCSCSQPQEGYWGNFGGMWGVGGGLHVGSEPPQQSLLSASGLVMIIIVLSCVYLNTKVTPF